MVTRVRDGVGNRFEVTYLADWLASIDSQFHYCHRWIPRTPARNVEHVFVAIHGLGDHGGRFDTFGRHMASQGFGVQAVDLTGHGRSPGKRGRINSYDDLLSEIGWSIREANQVWKNAQVTLIGHSMGGNLVLNYLDRVAGQIQHGGPADVCPLSRYPDRIIAVAPMLRPYGRQIREDFLQVGCRLAKWVPNWPMRMNHRSEKLTADPQASETYDRDPLIHRSMSIRLGIELLLAGRRLIQENRQHDLSCLLIHGTEDRLADIEASRSYCRLQSGAQLWELPDELHDPLNGLMKYRVYARIADWCGLDGRTKLSGLKRRVA
jgi:alpha-beta hydrolase superfamily lysophospholipase